MYSYNYINFMYSCFMCLLTSDLPVDMCPSRRGKKNFTSLLLSSSSSYVLSTDNICTHSMFFVYRFIHGLHSDNVIILFTIVCMLNSQNLLIHTYNST